MLSPVSEFAVAFSLKKQSASGTKCVDGDMTRATPFRWSGPTSKSYSAANSDAGQVGKSEGDYATYWNKAAEVWTTPSRQYDMNELNAMLGYAFSMGAVATAQPDSTGDPTVWDLTFTFQDKGAANGVIPAYTTIKEEIAGASVDRYEYIDHCITSCGLVATGTDQVQLSMGGFARERATSAVAMPATTAGLSLFNVSRIALNFGPEGGADNITALELKSFQNTVLNNIVPEYGPGNAAGEEEFVRRFLIQGQRANGGFEAYFDATLRDHFLDHDLCDLVFTATGDAIGVTTLKAQVEITIARLKLSEENFGESDGLIQMGLNWSDDSVLKKASNSFISVKVRQDIVDNTEVLAVSS